MSSLYKISYAILLFSLLTTACKPSQKLSKKTIPEKEEPCCISSYKSYQFVPLIELGKEFRRLKALEENCCYKKNSAYYLLMKELGRQLGKPGTSKEKIFEVMGKADRSKTTSLHYELGSKKAMLFELKNNKVSKYQWFETPQQSMLQ